jgi:hypothetical protein
MTAPCHPFTVSKHAQGYIVLADVPNSSSTLLRRIETPQLGTCASGCERRSTLIPRWFRSSFQAPTFPRLLLSASSGD